jgi:hypothetical protein
MGWTQSMVGQVHALRWNADGSRLAVVCREGLFMLGADGAVLWKKFKRFGSVGAAWSPDGQRLAVAAGIVTIWSADGEQLEQLGGGEQIDVDWLDDDWIVTGTQGMAYGSERVVRPWQLSTEAPGWRAVLPKADGAVGGLAASPDGRFVVADGADSGTWTVLDATTGDTLHESYPDHVATTLTRFSPDGARVVVAGGNALGVASPPDAELTRVDAALGQVEAMDLAPDGVTAAVAAGPKTHVVSVLDGVCKATTERATAVAWSPDGALLALATKDGVLAVDAAAWCGPVVPRATRATDGPTLVDEAARMTEVAEARSEALLALIQVFGAVMSEEDDDARTQEARAFNGALDAFFDAFPTESVGSFAMYVSLALTDGDEAAARDIHGDVMADVLGVRAVGSDDG